MAMFEGESVLPKGGSLATSSFEKGPLQAGVTVMLSGDPARTPFLPRRTEGFYCFLLLALISLGREAERPRWLTTEPRWELWVPCQVNVCMCAQCEEDPEVPVDMT